MMTISLARVPQVMLLVSPQVMLISLMPKLIVVTDNNSKHSIKVRFITSSLDIQNATVLMPTFMRR
jgi:hypothetical protein